MKKDQKQSSDILRQKAEKLLKRASGKGRAKLSEDETLKLIHEFEVHQIELELQNDELAIAKEKTDEAVDKFTELYDFAPSGYFTLTEDGIIMELNLCGSQLLGKARTHLIGCSFGIFLSDDSKPVFTTFLERVFISKRREFCEVSLITKDNQSLYAYLTGIAVQKGNQCFLTLTDVTEYRHMENKLIESENRARAIINAIPDMMFMLDREGVYLDYKASKEDLYYQPETIIGKKNRDITPPEFGDLIDQKIELVS